MGGGIGMGNTCKPMAVSFQYMTKFPTNKKKKKKKKEIKKKKENNFPVGASHKEFSYHCRTLKRNGLDP